MGALAVNGWFGKGLVKLAGEAFCGVLNP